MVCLRRRNFGCSFGKNLAHEDGCPIGLVTLMPVERLLQRLNWHRTFQHVDAGDLIEDTRYSSLKRRHQHRPGQNKSQ